MSGYTRITLVGSRRRVDVVVPDDEPVGRLLPEALELTGEPSTSPAAERRLALLDGRLLDQDVSLGQAEVPDGSVVRIVGLADAPPSPVVLDVTEEAAEDFQHRSWRWGPQPRRWLATGLAVAATVGALAIAAPRPGERLTIGLVVLTAVLLVAGATLGRIWSSTIGTSLIFCGTAVGLYGVGRQDLPGPVAAATAAGVVALAVLALGVGSSLGRGGVLGGLLGLVLLGAWALATRVLPAREATACLAVLTAVLLGVLPRVAAMLAGLTSLDDRRSQGEPVRRRDVATALRATHRGLALATVAVAGSALAAGVGLATFDGRWTTILAVLLIVVVAVRVRAFPLVSEVVALAVALAGIGLALLLAWMNVNSGATRIVVGLLIAVALVGIASPLARVTPQLRARGRVLGDRLEIVAVVAMLPVLVGVFGVYPRLLASF